MYLISLIEILIFFKVGLIDRVIWLSSSEEFSTENFIIGNLNGTNLIKTNSGSIFIGDNNRLEIDQEFGEIQHNVIILHL